MSAVLPAVAEQLFRDIHNIYQETSQIPDDLLIALTFVFGQWAVQALDLVDQHSVTCLSSPSGRKAFQVTGGSGCLYTCFASCHYCPCPAFAYMVLRRNKGLLCKHILAVYLCEAMGVTHTQSVPDQQMTVLLSGTSPP
ncbi:zinc finger SWIM domain-containing protein 7 [Nerophis lumbriciformis]|uniref:zinc finger SWIM domain-containing protein 7 n=1 Tax=Nerophis lumbriciformis TaxID=546530 RepID=UPI002ADF8514|nr:zinc finger SWIM domain-containing protein 7-like [Nerophis lumbriciformis]XP_061819319.1 zinc finger SWIM domain-containing protein 7-like [Nerophis lumbriciformis]XP_061819320.1 zinc finger SWIM domain-containing protein 7-like [Nerophis lumbriciformis]XP_061819321.1 zinc finger SWIM domain-containing protein 7-like [Nerophis lumbriciformis]